MKPTSQMIRTFADPILHRPCEDLRQNEDSEFLLDMRAVCRELKGVGLAAPQIGVAKRVCFIHHQPKRQRGYWMINPVRIAHETKFSTEQEGCLSYPGVYVNVERALTIHVQYFDENWMPKDRVIEGWEARVIQHEMHHLDGICLVGDFWRKRT